MVNPSDCTTVSPCFTKKVGSQATKPYTATLIATQVSAAVSVRPITGFVNSTDRGTLRAITGCAGGTGGSAPN